MRLCSTISSSSSQTKKIISSDRFSLLSRQIFLMDPFSIKNKPDPVFYFYYARKVDSRPHRNQKFNQSNLFLYLLHFPLVETTAHGQDSNLRLLQCLHETHTYLLRALNLIIFNQNCINIFSKSGRDFIQYYLLSLLFIISQLSIIYNYK